MLAVSGSGAGGSGVKRGRLGGCSNCRWGGGDVSGGSPTSSCASGSGWLEQIVILGRRLLVEARIRATRLGADAGTVTAQEPALGLLDLLRRGLEVLGVIALEVQVRLCMLVMRMPMLVV